MKLFVLFSMLGLASTAMASTVTYTGQDQNTGATCYIRETTKGGRVVLVGAGSSKNVPLYQVSKTINTTHFVYRKSGKIALTVDHIPSFKQIYATYNSGFRFVSCRVFTK